MEHKCDHMPDNARIFSQEEDGQSFLELSEQGLDTTGTTLVETTNKMQTPIWHCPYCGKPV